MSVLPSPLSDELKVLVLAGSNRSPAAAGRTARRPRGRWREVPLEGKAFLELRGRLVIEHVLDWLAGAGLRRIWVLAPPAHLELIPGRYRVTPIPQPDGASLASNLRTALELVPMEPDEPALVVFGDHPLTTTRALLDFLEACAPLLEEADFFHGLALRDAYLAFYPHFHRTSVSTRDASGRATGLNLVIPSRLHRIPAFDHIYSVRKLERVGRFLSMLLREIYLLGSSAPHAVLDSARLWVAKEFEKLSRRDGAIGRFGARRLEWLRNQVPLKRLEGYAATLVQAERGVRVIPLAHGGTAIDVDFAEELDLLETRWDELREITRRQDDAAGRRQPSSAGTSSVSRYAVR